MQDGYWRGEEEELKRSGGPAAGGGADRVCSFIYGGRKETDGTWRSSGEARDLDRRNEGRFWKRLGVYGITNNGSLLLC